MTRLSLVPLLAAMLAAPLLAQGAPAEGDLIPRNGTLVYMVSDKPDIFYRLFGTDKDGKWRLRNLANESLEKETAEAKDPEKAKAARDIMEYVLNGYESLQQVETGLIDVTLDGPKYLMHMRLKAGKTIDLKPKFLAEFLDREVEHRGTKYLLYRANKDVPLEPETPKKPDGEAAAPTRRGKGAYGMDRWYVAGLGESVLISNFESTIRDSIDLWQATDRSDALSARSEFKQWREGRGRHDLSVFVVGREVQNLAERLLPSKEQAGVDAQMIYNTLDSWLQFREYRYVVFDFDYDEKAHAATMAATLKTARPTRLLEKLAIEPGKFTMLKYVPEGAVFTAGMQLGDPKKTFDNLVELARDMQKIGVEIEKMAKSGARRIPPDMPPPEERARDEARPEEPRKEERKEEVKPEQPKDEQPAPEGAGNPWLPRSMAPLEVLGDLLKAAQEEEKPATPAEKDHVEEFLKEMDKALAEYGTTREEILGALGNQVVTFGGLDEAVASKAYRGDMGNLFRDGLNFGVIVAIKDVAKAREIIGRAAEKDPEGAFKGMKAVEFEGVTLNISPARAYGYAFTADALLIAISGNTMTEDYTTPVSAVLKAMLAAPKGTARTGFVAEGSKFLEMDFSVLARVEGAAAQANLRRLDRFTRPPLKQDFMQYLSKFTVTLRSREFKDGFEVALRIGGIPDFATIFLDNRDQIFEGGNADSEAWSYTEENLRQTANALRTQAGKGELDVDALVKGGQLRAGALQTPFDVRWKGGRDKLGWITLDQLKRDEKGELPQWVNKQAAETIEKNEKEGFRSFKLAEGKLGEHLNNYATGMIVLYQEKPDTLGGHMLLYADGQVGWLHAEALKQALDLNKEGKPVPAEDAWRGGGEKPERDASTPSRPAQPKGEDNPWLPPKD